MILLIAVLLVTTRKISAVSYSWMLSFKFPYCQEREIFDFLKPTGYVMHHQFNIQQLYALSTLYLCVLYLSENKQRLVPLTA